MNDLLKYFFTPSALVPVNLPGKLFSPLHIITSVILCAVLPAAAFLLRKTDKRRIRKICFALWISLVLMDIGKWLWCILLYPGGPVAYGMLPLYPCSTIFFTLPFAASEPKTKFFKTVKRCSLAFICTIGLGGAAVYLVYPANVLTEYPLFSYLGIHTVYFHGTIVFTALLLIFSGCYDFDFADFPLASIPLLILSIPSNIVSFAVSGDYMFFKGTYFPFSAISASMPFTLWVILLYLFYIIVPLVFYIPAYIIKKHR